MTVREIVHILDPKSYFDGSHSLRQVCRPVNFATDDVKGLCADLRDTFYSMKIAVGLAAPQIGIQLRALIINATKRDLPPDASEEEKRRDEIIVINPTILKMEGSAEPYNEACMSVPNRRGNVDRPGIVHVGFHNERGRYVRKVFSGFMARIALHENDHLNGVLYIDRLNDLSETFEDVYFTEENYAFLNRKKEC